MGCTESCECSQENIDALQAMGNRLDSNFVGDLHVPTIWKVVAALTAAIAIVLIAVFWMKKRRERRRRKRQKRFQEQLELYRRMTESISQRQQTPETENQQTGQGEQNRRLGP